MQSIRKHITKRAPMRAMQPALVPLLLIVAAASAAVPISPERFVSSLDDTYIYESIPEIMPVSGKPELLMAVREETHRPAIVCRLSGRNAQPPLWPLLGFGIIEMNQGAFFEQRGPCGG